MTMSRQGLYKWLVTIFCLMSVLPMPAANATEIVDIDISRDGNRYRVAMDVKLAASPQLVFDVMTRYQDLPLINPAVLRVDLQSREDNTVRLHTTTRVCVGPLCRTLIQLQDIVEQADAQPLLLSASVIPEYSNLRYGEALWQFAACGSDTCLHFRSEIEPAFRVPPIIGPWLIQRALRNEARVTSEGIERLARERPPGN